MTKRGFTLIELLVVIAIIAILASIMLPALGRAREKVHAVACMNNQKQIGMAFLIYVDDHNDFLPPPVGGPARTSAAGPHSRWAHAHATDSTPIYADILVDMNYVTEDIFYCPSVPRVWGVTAWLNWSGPSISYGIPNWFHPNEPIGGINYSWGSNDNRYYKHISSSSLSIPLRAIDYPERGMLVADKGTRESFYRTPFLWESNFWNPATQDHGQAHGNGTNVLFFAGHVELRTAEFWPTEMPANPPNARAI